MDAERLRELLESVKGGSLSIESALGKLATLPFSDLGYARVDHHRALRHGIAESMNSPPVRPRRGWFGAA